MMKSGGWVKETEAKIPTFLLLSVPACDPGRRLQAKTALNWLRDQWAPPAQVNCLEGRLMWDQTHIPVAPVQMAEAGRLQV